MNKYKFNTEHGKYLVLERFKNFMFIHQIFMFIIRMKRISEKKINLLKLFLSNQRED